MSINLPSEPRYLSRNEASKYLAALGLSVAIRTLAKLAVQGGGPSYVKWGRSVRYPREALEAWVTNRIGPLRRSTNETVTPDQ